MEEIKEVFAWAIRQSAITELKKTVRKKLNSVPLYQNYALFRLHFILERNKHYGRADFFHLKWEAGKSAADNWKRTLENQNNSKVYEKTAADFRFWMIGPIYLTSLY